MEATVTVAASQKWTEAMVARLSSTRFVPHLGMLQAAQLSSAVLQEHGTPHG